MECSCNTFVFLLTTNAPAWHGGQQHTMVIRAVCPQCKSPKEKKNGRILLVTLFLSYMATMTMLDSRDF
jgi:hypothetical protein